MSKFDEAFIRITSLFIVLIIVTPIVILGLLRLAHEAGVMIAQ